MYVCEPCVRANRLEDPESAIDSVAFTLTGSSISAPCEICGALRDDWSYKRVYWTGHIHRTIGEPDAGSLIAAQIEKHLATLAEKGGSDERVSD